MEQVAEMTVDEAREEIFRVFQTGTKEEQIDALMRLAGYTRLQADIVVNGNGRFDEIFIGPSTTSR